MSKNSGYLKKLAPEEKAAAEKIINKLLAVDEGRRLSTLTAMKLELRAVKDVCSALGLHRSPTIKQACGPILAALLVRSNALALAAAKPSECLLACRSPLPRPPG